MDIISSRVRHTALPASYVRPESDRPNLAEVQDCDDVPIIDLGCEDRTSTAQQLRNACQNFGFFHVINHGVSTELVEKMLEVANEFFRLPVEEKLKLNSDDPAKTMRLNVKKETVHNWTDNLRPHFSPLDQYVPEWPSDSSSFKDTVSNYCKEVRELGFRLQELIAESLGLEKDHMVHIKDVLGEQGQHMGINYYPPCPQLDLTYGLPGHTGLNALTILLPDLQVSGLQVLKHGKWMAIKPHPKAFVVRIGDQLQVLYAIAAKMGQLQNEMEESRRLLNFFLKSVRTQDPARKEARIRTARERIEDLEGRQQALRAEQQVLIVHAVTHGHLN